MLGKRSGPMIGKITELLVSGSRSVFSDVATSPVSPLELKIHSPRGPRGLKSYDVTAGVGLGIVAALDKSGDCAVGTEILARYTVPSPRPIRTDPMPVISGQNCGRSRACFKEPEMDSYVRHHKVAGIFSVSPVPAKFLEEAVTEFHVSDFLSSCHMCRKKLHGKDIYMYRGEKAFCSTDCRERQIVMDDDDRKEQCRSEARRSVDVSRSSYNQGNMFSTGIMAI